MLESEISKDKPYLLNDDFNINPTTYEITDEDLVINYTSSKEVTRALAMVKEWKYAKRFTSNTITFTNSDFEVGSNNISVVDVNYSDGTYGRFTGGIIVVKKEAIVPPPVVDNPPTISQNIQNQEGTLGETFTITYEASDDNEIVKHEIFNGNSWIAKEAFKDGETYSITIKFTKPGVKNCKIRVTDNKNQQSISNDFTITVNEVVIDTPPVIDQFIQSQEGSLEDVFTIAYTASDDNLIIKHEFYDGNTWIVKNPNQTGNTYKFTHNFENKGVKNCKVKISDSNNQIAISNDFSITIRDRISTKETHKDYLLLFNENEKLKRIINSDEFYDDEFKSTATGERTLTFKMKDQVVDIEMGDKIGIFSEGKFDLFIVDQVEAETYYSTDIKVTCLHDFYSIQEQKAITQYYSEKVTLREAITDILRGTEYVLGKCPERAIKPIGPYLYKNPLWCIQDIVSNFNVEVDYSIELNENRNGISRKVLNVVNALGSDTGIRCSTDLNVSKIKRVQKKKFYTVMYGCGAEYQKDLVKYKYDFKDVVWTTPNNPADKPKGQEFVEDKEAIAKYGRKIGIFEDGRIKEPELLLKKTWEALQKNNKPFVSYELDIEELKTEDGYEHLNFKLGDLIILQNTIDNSRAKFRIVEDCKSIRNKYKRKIVVGEQVKGIFSGGDTGNSDGTEGPGGSVIEPGTGEDIRPPSIEEILPDTLPKIPVVTAHGLWKNVQLSWTYENKIYYDYEVYASRIRDFEPTVFHMIYSGKASAFLHEAGANETWYYRVRAVNSFGNATQFSEQVEVHTTKVSDGTEYFESAAIKDALIEELRLDRGWIGTLRGHYIDARELSVTDGNGKRTFDIDSFGNVVIDSNNIKTRGQDVASIPYVTNKIDGLDIGGRNYLRNASFLNTLEPHQLMNTSAPGVIGVGWLDGKSVLQMTDIGNWNETQYIKLKEVPVNRKKGFIISLDIYSKTQCTLMIDPTGVIDAENRELNITATNQWIRYTIQLPPGAGSNRDGMTNIQIYAKQGTKFTGYITDIMIEHGNKPSDFDLSFEDLDVKANEIATKVNSFEEQITPDALKRVFSTEFYTKDSANSQFASKTEVIQNSEELRLQISKTGGVQMIPNGDLMGGAKFWSPWQGTPSISIADNKRFYNVVTDYVGARSSFGIITPEIYVSKGVTYTVGCLVSGNINALNYNYLMEYRDGQYVGKQRIDDVTLGDVSNYYKRISITFKAEFTGPAYVMFGNENYQPQGATFRIGEVCCYEGSILYPFKPNESANYVGDVYFDITGMGMKHEDGSISRITSKAFELSDTLGRTKVSMKRGNYHIYHPDNGHLLGFISGDGIMGPEYRGVNFSMAGSSHYLALGNTSSLNDEENFAVNPIVTLAYYDLYNTPYGTIGRGINFQSLPCVFHEVPLFKKFLYTPQVASSTPKLKFCAKSGSLDLNLMTLHGDDQEMTMGCPIRMNGHPITGAPVGYSVINSRSDIELFDVNRMPIESKDIFDEIKVVKSEFKCFKSASNVGEIGHLDVSSVTNKDEIMLDENSADLGKLVTILFKKVKEQDEKNKNLENIVNELVKAR